MENIQQYPVFNSNCIYLGDNCIQNFLFGMYIDLSTVGSLDLHYRDAYILSQIYDDIQSDINICNCITGLLLRVHKRKTNFLFLNQDICCEINTQNNHLNETVLLITQNICF